MHPLLQIPGKCRRDGLIRSGEIHDAGFQGQASEKIVVVVVGRAVRRDLCRWLESSLSEHARVVHKFANGQVGRNVIGVFTQICEGHDVPHVLDIRLHVHHIHFDAVDHGAGVGHRQGLHRLVVLVHEILRQEEVAVGFVVVRPDVKFLGLCATLHFNLAALAFLLAEHGGVVQPAPLGFQFDPKQTLRAGNQRTVQRHVDVAGLHVLQDVVLFSLEANVHLVLKIEQRLCVVLGAEFNLVANLAVEVQLDALVKIHAPSVPLALGNARVVRLVSACT